MIRNFGFSSMRLASLWIVLCLPGCISLPTYYNQSDGQKASFEAEQLCRIEADFGPTGNIDPLSPRSGASAAAGALIGNSMRQAFEFRAAYKKCMERRGYVAGG